MKRLLPEVDVVLLTTTETERDALYEVMKPFPGYAGLVEGAIQHNTYRLGQFGRYLVAHVESTMGSQARHGSTLTVHDAIAELSPKAVVILGIAFGINPVKQRLGDVIIAETVIPYELQRIGQKAIHRGQPLQCGPILSERFRTRRTDWKHERGEDTVEVFQGPLLSGEKLADNLAFRDALAGAFPTACGGEMEGAGAYAATERNDVEVILVKAICDWGDGSKTDRAQPFAAQAAVSLAHHVLSKQGVLEALHARDSEPQEAAAPRSLPASSPVPPLPPLRTAIERPQRAVRRTAQEAPAVRSLMNLLGQPFSLLLGDHWRLTQERLRQLLHARLRGTPWGMTENSSLSELAQVYALHFGNESLSTQFRDAEPSLGLIEALAQRLPPGVHVTLQRLPVLEQAIVRQQPGLPLFVIHPSRPGDGIALVRRHVVGQGWVSLDALPDAFDLKSAILLLRLYQSYLPDQMFDRLPLAEDDFLVGTQGLESMLPPKLVDTILSGLYERPTLVLGLSLSVRDHQLALHHLFGHRPLPRRSTVLLEPSDAETLPWLNGRGLPGGAGLQVVQAETVELAKLMGMAEPERLS
ncbi:hypothetical protein ACN28E_41280 [Archangium lansingense]|uniref:5'-methylthioadenosine/S-adenosylhomocysteine nucleosidase family protein n=1 Tax=Archangium lansingense TaxID=2995310 RepID=UPI003B7F70AB